MKKMNVGHQFTGRTSLIRVA